MATIKVDGDTMRSTAQEITSLREQHDTMIQQIGVKIHNLAGVAFEGQAATAYIAKYESMQGTFTQFSEMLQEFATKLDAAAENFVTLDNSIAGSM